MNYSWLVPNLTFPLYDWLSGSATWKRTKNLHGLQWSSPAELEARSQERLRALLAHAYEQVPYYRESFQRAGLEPADINSLADLAKLPVLTRHAVREHHKGLLLAQGIPDSRKVAASTSGSSGMPVAFYKDKHSEAHARSSLLLFRQWADIDFGDVMLWIASPTHSLVYFDHNPLLFRLARRFLLGEKIILAPGLDLQLSDLERVLRRLPRDRDYWIYGYPSYLNQLAAQIEENESPLFRLPKAVISYAETLHPLRRQGIKQAFGCEVYNLYSTNESYHLAQSCPDRPELLHYNSDCVILRVVDRQGLDVKPGQSGRVLLTDLHNYVMPLINYELGDRALKGGACPCGRGLPTLQSIEGRVSELVHTPAGRSIDPITFGRYLLHARGNLNLIREFQVRQDRLDCITLLIVPTIQFNQSSEQVISQGLRELLGSQIGIDIRLADNIPAEKSGKRLTIKSSLSSANASPV